MKQQSLLKHFIFTSTFLLLTTGSFSLLLDNSYSYLLELKQSYLWGNRLNKHTLRLTAKNDDNNTASFVDSRTATTPSYTYADFSRPVASQVIFTTNSQAATGKIDLTTPMQNKQTNGTLTHVAAP